jgi:putative transposase
MSVLTFRYKLKPSTTQYAALKAPRWHLRNLRNGCLQELKDSYGAARRAASRHGRDRPIAKDWIEVRGEEIREFVAWQDLHEPDLRRRHERAETRRIAKLFEKMADGRTIDLDAVQRRPWKAKTAADFGRPISKADQYRRLAEIRASDPDGIGSIPLTILRDQIDIVHKAMDAFYDRVKLGQKPGFPRFKSYDRVRSYGCGVGTAIQIKGDRLYAPMLWHGGVRINMHRDLEGVPKTVRLIYDGRFWHAGITCRMEDENVVHPRAGIVCGVDAGVTRLLTFDDGTFEENPRYGETAAPEIRRLVRRLARAKRGGHARIKAKRALASAHRRLRNRRLTNRHRIAKSLALRAERIFIEDLNIKNMMASAAGTMDEPGNRVAQKRGLNRGIADAAIATIYRMTRYKAERAGGAVIAVDPRNTSTDCSECGGREPEARDRSSYRCSCGAHLHADHNAARNVLARGLLKAA